MTYGSTAVYRYIRRKWNKQTVLLEGEVEMLLFWEDQTVEQLVEEELEPLILEELVEDGDIVVVQSINML